MATGSNRKSINSRSARSLLALFNTSVFLLFASGFYLALVAVLEQVLARQIENATFQMVFASHLFVGVIFTLAFVAYFFAHLRSIQKIKNPAAIKAGIYLSLVVVVIAISGVLLTRGVELFEITDSAVRLFIYMTHVFLSAVSLVCYCFHRSVGRSDFTVKNLNLAILSTLILALCALPLHYYSENQIEEPLEKNSSYPFFPSLLKTNFNATVDAKDFMRVDYCQECHEDTHDQWHASAHHFSSFNNPFYSFSVNNTREFLMERNGNVDASRFCAGCHDPIPLMTGLFDDPEFSAQSGPSATAGITCTVCHSIESIDSPRGNADFTLGEVEHYPFAFSESEPLRWFNKLLIKSNPGFHKKTFLKPLHQTPEFCGACHKVHIPKELNNYRWLRGQNHYDSFQLSGVSGHNVDSFYYPKKAKENCNDCHMADVPSDDITASREAFGAPLTIKDHLYASSNTALPFTQLDSPGAAIDQHKAFLEKSLRIDIVGLRRGGGIDGEFVFASDLGDAMLSPGEPVMLEVVLRTLTLGHSFTNGTTDSNQIWIEIEAVQNGAAIAHLGGMSDDGTVDAFSTHQVKNHIIDIKGEPISERNVEDIYTTVRNNQIPPGAADVVHYRFKAPTDNLSPIEIRAKLHYRKFSKDYAEKSLGIKGGVSSLPVTTIATDSLVLNAVGVNKTIEESKPAQWLRLNDYGIALLRKPGKKQYRQAEEIFKLVQAMGHAQGTLNLIRLYYREGRLAEASDLLSSLDAAGLDNPWSAQWYSALINIDNGYFIEGIESLVELSEVPWSSVKDRGFDFSFDYKLLNKLADSIFILSTMEGSGSEKQRSLSESAKEWYEKVLTLDPENARAHYGLARIAKRDGIADKVSYHTSLHKKYKKDEHAEEEAVTLARSLDKNLDRLANPVVIYELK